MQKYACYLRAVNVGGTGKLPMSELKKICEKLGFKNVKTYIASGNVIFETIQSNHEIKFRSDISTAHLWFEEAIAGDKTHDVQSDVLDPITTYHQRVQETLDPQGVAIGFMGETIARRWLSRHGRKVLYLNYRGVNQGEVDILARHRNVLTFVEVKTRSSNQHGEPEEAVKKGKRSKLIKAANAYIQLTGCDLAARFDIVSVILHPSGKPYIHHIPEAFYPTVHDKPF